MKQKLPGGFWSILIVVGILISTMSYGQPTLKHSWTFDDNTPNDYVGNAHASLSGPDAVITDGALVLSGGYAVLPAQTIGISEYSSISIEAVFTQSDLLDPYTFTVLCCFGGTHFYDPSWGIDYLIWQPTRGDGAYSRFSMSCGDYNYPWVLETGVNGPFITANQTHYSVCVVTDTEMSLYLDGILIGTQALAPNNQISALSNDSALIGASLYYWDPRWLGSVDELNIYEGEMDEAMVRSRACELLSEAPVTLSDIQLSTGHLSGEINMETTDYTVIVPNGTTSVDVTGIPICDATIVSGGGTVNLSNGMGFTVITLTSGDGTASKDYNITVYESKVTSGKIYALVHEASGFFAQESGYVFNQVILANPEECAAGQLWQFVESGVEGQYFIKNQLGNYMVISPPPPGAPWEIWNLEVSPELPSVDLDSARFIWDEFEPGRFKIRSVKRMKSDEPTHNMLGPDGAEEGWPLYNDKWPGSWWDAVGLTVWRIEPPLDDQPPVITATTDPFVLLNRNHKYVTFEIDDFDVNASDNCQFDVVISKVTSDEAEDIVDPYDDPDGSTLDDMVISGDCQSVMVRGERAGNGDGRVYTVELTATDLSGNKSTAYVEIHVPHDTNDDAVNSGPVYEVEGKCSMEAEMTENKSAFIPEVLGNDFRVYPNPFAERVYFEFSRAEDCSGTLELYDLTGRKIAILFDQYMEANHSYRIEFTPEKMATNMIIYRMTFDNEVINGKLINKQ